MIFLLVVKMLSTMRPVDFYKDVHVFAMWANDFYKDVHVFAMWVNDFYKGVHVFVMCAKDFYSIEEIQLENGQRH